MQHLLRVDLRVVEHALLARGIDQRGVDRVVDEVGLPVDREHVPGGPHRTELGARADQEVERRLEVL